MLALENPHCGVSGVPFINRTTGAEATALSIACRVSVDRNLEAMGVIRGYENLEANFGAGRAAFRKAYVTHIYQHISFTSSTEDFTLADDNSGLASILNGYDFVMEMRAQRFESLMMSSL